MAYNPYFPPVLNEYQPLPWGGSGPRLMSGSAIPTSGPGTGWGLGDIIINNNPQSGAPFAWMCISAGNPGIWTAFGGNGPATPVTTANYSLLPSDNTIEANATSNAITLTLPNATTSTGKSYLIIKTDATANTVTVNTTASQTIDGTASRVLSGQWNVIDVRSDGTNWITVNRLQNPVTIVTTTAYTATDADALIICNPTAAGAITIPTATGLGGKQYTLKRIGATYAVTITPATGTIDGAANYALSAQYKYVVLAADGATTDWHVIGNN
jgi:hypothetical protein